MGGYRAGVGRVHDVYPPDELQEGGGVLGDPVVRPGGVLELPHLPPVRVAHLEGGGEKGRQVSEVAVVKESGRAEHSVRSFFFLRYVQYVNHCLGCFDQMFLSLLLSGF